MIDYEKISQMNPSQKAQLLAEAVRFCLRHHLFRPGEISRMKHDRQFLLKMGPESLLRRDLYLKAHPDQL